MLNFKISSLKEALLKTADEITEAKIKVAENINDEFEAMKSLKILSDLKNTWNHFFQPHPRLTRQNQSILKKDLL